MCPAFEILDFLGGAGRGRRGGFDDCGLFAGGLGRGEEQGELDPGPRRVFVTGVHLALVLRQVCLGVSDVHFHL